MGSSKIVVVGGGVGGLATAALLARGGADVTLLERNEQVGGRAGSWEVDGFRFDTGPSWYLMPEVFEHFFALLGEDINDHLDLVTLDPAYRVFFETPDGAVCREEPGHVLDVGDDLATNLDRFDTLEPGAGARIGEYVERSATPTAWRSSTSSTPRSSGPIDWSTATSCAVCPGSRRCCRARSSARSPGR